MSNRKDAILGFFKAHLKIFAGIALSALIVALVAGGILLYRYRAGPELAFKQLRVALQEGDKDELARIIDFRSLSADIVQAVIAAYPQAAANAIQKAEMQDEAQRLVLKALAAARDTKQETVLPHKLFEAVPFLPNDFIIQFAAGMKLEKTSGGAQIRSQFTNNELQVNFPVLLLAEHKQNGWMVTRLLNAQELVGLYKNGMAAILAEDQAKLAEKNEKIMLKMRSHFASPQCLAAANMMSSEHEAMLVVKVTAKNTDSTTLHSVNVLCDVHASNGTLVYSRQLEAVQRVNSGEAFSNTWTIVLDAGGEEAAKLLRAGPLSCTVEPKVMSVGVGEILYPRKD